MCLPVYLTPLCASTPDPLRVTAHEEPQHPGCQQPSPGPSLCHGPTNAAPDTLTPSSSSLTTHFLFCAPCAVPSAHVSVTNTGLVSCRGVGAGAHTTDCAG